MELNPQQEVVFLAPEFTDEIEEAIADVEEAKKPLITTFNFHSPVRAVAISPNGHGIAVGLEDGTIEIRDLPIGSELVSWTGHESEVFSVAFSSNGTMIVSGSKDNSLCLWDLQGEPIGQPFWGHKGWVNSVAFSPDDTMIVSGSDDYTVRLWNLQGEPIAPPFQGHEGWVNSVAFSPDGTKIVSGSKDNSLRLWDLQGQPIGQPFLGHEDAVRSVAFSPDGTKIISASLDKTVRLWDLQGQLIGEPFQGHENGVYSVAFSLDGTMIVSSSRDKTVRLWNLQGQLIAPPFRGHQSSVYSVAFSPDGTKIVSGSRDKTVRVWDLQPQKLYINRIAEAFRNDKPTGEDALDVGKELRAIADVLMLRSLQPPLAVAIVGGWGSGKSFGMHLIKQQINKIRCQPLTSEQAWNINANNPNLSPFVGHVYQIEFNAWSYAKSDLWASLMQTIFDQLDRQLTLEKQLGEFKDLLQGGEIWRVLNQMVESDRKEILESGLGEVFTKFQDKSSENELWNILSEVRSEEQKKLEKTETELRTAQKAKEQIEQELQQYQEQIEQEVNQKRRTTAIVTLFLAQLKELSKDDFGSSIFKEFLHSYGFKGKQDLENRLSLNLTELSTNSNLIDKAEEIIEDQHEQINTIINNAQRVKHFLEAQPAKILGLVEFIKKDKKIWIIFIFWLTVPFVIYFCIVNFLIPNLPILSNFISTVKIGITALFTIPAINQGITVFKRIRKFQIQAANFLRSAQANIEQEQQNLVAKKEEEIAQQLKNKSDYDQKQEELADKEKEIQKLQAQVELQKQRAGLTAQYTSLSEFINKRLEEDSYQKLLGIMHQIQDDLQDLSDHLTYKVGNQNKLNILKQYFPRGPARIVLYIDDLDRCPPNTVVQVLEAIQLLLNTEIFVVILAIDDRYISRALETCYKGVLKRGGTPSGVDYLEKIIQIPYKMRPIADKAILERYLKSLIDIKIEEDAEQNNRRERPESINYDLNSDNQVQNQQNIQNDIQDEVETQSFQPEQSQVLQQREALLLVEKFTQAEFDMIKECCQHVDLTPRTAKRLINICKIIKIIWTPTPNDQTWEQEPEEKVKQTLIAFLALAGRYPVQMRKLLEEIYLRFETENQQEIILEKDSFIEELEKQNYFIDIYVQREWQRFKNDFIKMPPLTEFIFEKRTFNLATSFCFVGDVGYDPDDYYNPQYNGNGKNINF
ncbi:P-loop NTPase fold protein [Nostoc sp. MS1]|uniref:P-loop NTPase fold protein n=1 Tax=Nostoc sp. MS1 TaxID=2764711 RepID=UPI001CC44A3E|nr:P-loop NTPase fold protein [Nostoc sp. MS1]BCL34903.1 hypothetical protein NSMS1_13500 [Nostoc sp. MS1]